MLRIIPSMRFACILLFLLPSSTGSAFNLYPIVTSANASDQEEACKNLGYDGLAILNSPEAHAYAMKMVQKFMRDEYFYVGLRYYNDTGDILWDDGTPIVSDYPVTVGDTPMIGRIKETGMIRLLAGSSKRYALCGNHNNLPSEAYGTTVQDIRPCNLTSVIYEKKVGRYVECAVLCSTETDCKAARYDVETQVCTIIALGGYRCCNATSASSTFTFFRTRFQNMDPCL